MADRAFANPLRFTPKAVEGETKRRNKSSTYTLHVAPSDLHFLQQSYAVEGLLAPPRPLTLSFVRAS